MSIQYVKGVGPKRKELLNKLGIYTIEDLLTYYPRDYEDRSSFKTLDQAVNGEKASFRLRVIGYPTKIKTRGNLNILKVPVEDETNRGFLTWFNQNYMANRIKIGQVLYANGRVNRRGGNIEITSPDISSSIGTDVGGIKASYSLTAGLTNNQLSKIIENAFMSESYTIKESLPNYILNTFNLIDRKKALKQIHFPSSKKELVEARLRLVFEELLILQLTLFLIKSMKTADEGIIHREVEESKEFIENLPFKLTNAQLRVFNEIEKDMESKKQMNRLVQGDVGSGKTMVAILAMLKACKSGYQAAMMAPTEILAKQHYNSVKSALEEYEIKVDILIGSMTEKEKKVSLEAIENGETDILIGTHALIQDGVNFKNLSLAITDEQHRFGVEQRGNLSSKGKNPDILVMTATPIPRTLALILYGDLDISIIDELPAGRQSIDTYSIGPSLVERMNGFIKKQIDEGRQAYIVAPLIEDNEKLMVNSVKSVYQAYRDAFPSYKVDLLYGEMKGHEKEEVMDKFKSGLTDILVSTTVIEVGVDVPNANIICIYNAERFGLAQLHQLRGRVGRGSHKSYCILINEGTTQISKERMRVLEKSDDGFLISEKDLELRGPGEFFGTRQHGLPELKIANLFRDMGLLKEIQKLSIKILESDPYLESSKNKLLKIQVENMLKNIEEGIVLN